MSKEELEREAGGKIFSSDNEETRNQVENTRYQGQSSSGSATETRLTENTEYESSNSGIPTISIQSISKVIYI